MAGVNLPRITDGLHDDPNCPLCLGEGLACESHPWRPWGPAVETEPEFGADRLGCWCGAPGKPCPQDSPCPVCSEDGQPKWPERCPPHNADQHIFNDPNGGSVEGYVLSRSPTPAEAERWRAAIMFGPIDLSMETQVAVWRRVGVDTVWIRRER